MHAHPRATYYALPSREQKTGGAADLGDALPTELRGLAERFYPGSESVIQAGLDAADAMTDNLRTSRPRRALR